ncbi:nucleoside-diphosphate sugar epimerase/dehydratase [soil metagenome]
MATRLMSEAARPTRRRRLRAAAVAAADATCVIAAMQIALVVRYDGTVPAGRLTDSIAAMALAVVAQVLLGSVTGLYRGHYRPASFEEMLVVGKTTVAAAAVVTVADIFVLGRSVPVTVALAYAPLMLVGASMVRWLWRADQERRIRASSHDATPIVVVGAGEAGAQIVNQLLRTRDCAFRPVALLDDDPAKLRLRVCGIPVVGTSTELVATARQLQVKTVLLAMPSAESSVIRGVTKPAQEAGLTVLTLPSLVEIFGGDVGIGDIRPVTEEDLLGRGPVEIDIDAIADYLTGRTVMVTGAGGSIGSELCRQIHRFAPDHLIMLDRDESALHGTVLSIHGRATLDSRDLVVCDIRDTERLDEVFAEHQPEVVFHAAALKHQPLLEMYPGEAVKSNCTGTLNLLRAATEHGVDRFVNVSTDKAADPTSVLGLSKRVAERITAHWAENNPGTFLSVRFGNVLGSRGSVLTTFRAQLALGGPITVTHPDVTRFFMTIEEAVKLVIQAGALDMDGHALILDIGEAIRIDDVARRLAASSDRPIEITYTGLRPGEKLHEILVAPHEVGANTRHPLITEVPVAPLDPDRLG